MEKSESVFVDSHRWKLLETLLGKVGAMRIAQGRYFRYRATDDLLEARRLEHEVDKLVHRLSVGDLFVSGS